MPTTIDLENAKQIRQPMDVIISIEIPDEGTNLTFSGYTESAKVADGVLSHRDWPMRRLADLQENGFPLDGSRVLYDPNTSASSSNGKIGVRGNIGAPVTITVTGSRTIASLSIFATGATSVTYNGTTSQIAGGQVIIPVGATSITLTFNPAGTTTRIEVSDIIPGTVLNITNDTLIKAVVSLRSDLSIIDPTLPESELNVEVYNDADISEAVASIPEDSPITYRAGYDNDLSPERKFYVAGQVTWADNVLSIHAVDAVHFLDVETFPMFIGNNWSGEWYPMRQGSGVWGLYEALKDQLRMSRISFNAEASPPLNPGGVTTTFFYSGSIVKRQGRRELIANMINLFHPFTPRAGVQEFWLTYVDAGRPTVRWAYPSARWDISEADCADVARNTEPRIKSIVAKNETIESSGQTATREAGTGTLMRDSLTAFYDYQQLCIDSEIYAEKEGVQPVHIGFTGYDDENTMLPATVYVPEKSELYGAAYGKFLLDNEIGTNSLADPYDAEAPSEPFPWSHWSYKKTTKSVWDTIVNRGIAEETDTACALTLIGRYFITTQQTQTYSRSWQGVVAYPEETAWCGDVYTLRDPHTALNLVAWGFYSLLNRSNITGSFTWKGDPRMQPRDVVEFHRLDGTVEEITLENITITHEGGGTSAEITYRKGIV